MHGVSSRTLCHLQGNPGGYYYLVILSDSSPSLELLSNPRCTHPLANARHKNVQRIRKQGREIKFTRLRAHIGMDVNERAHELAKIAILSTNPQDYDKYLINFHHFLYCNFSLLAKFDNYKSTKNTL